ncbi:MAG: hypothetical protein ACTSYF_17385 [Promethearchaeota archaeon]
MTKITVRAENVEALAEAVEKENEPGDKDHGAGEGKKFSGKKSGYKTPIKKYALVKKNYQIQYSSSFFPNYMLYSSYFFAKELSIIKFTYMSLSGF